MSLGLLVRLAKPRVEKDHTLVSAYDVAKHRIDPWIRTTDLLSRPDEVTKIKPPNRCAVSAHDHIPSSARSERQ